MKIKFTSVLIVILTIIAVTSTTLYTVTYLKTTKEADTSKGSAKDRRSARNSDTVYTVRTHKAEVLTLEDYVMTNGDVEALSSVSIYPNMGGKIVSTSVSLGSNVNRGDVIARIDPSQPGVNYALSPVTTPISGTVISTPLDIGTTVSTGTPIVVIGDIARLQITSYIPEKYVAYLAVGLKADVTLEGYPGVIFRATVTYVSPVLDTATRTKEVVLRFDVRDSRLNAGMFARVKLYTAERSGYVVVPSQAVLTIADARCVYVAKRDNTVERREVTEGYAVDGMVQITSGVEEGEYVVTEGGTVLFDGAKINDIS